MAAGGSIWARGRAMEAPARGVEGGGSSGATRGEARQAGGGFLAIAQRRAALRCLPAALRCLPRREVEEQAGGESGLVCNFKKSRDLTVNQR